MIFRRSPTLAGIAFIAILAIYYYRRQVPAPTSTPSQSPTHNKSHHTQALLGGDTASPLSPHVLQYFDQAFSLGRIENYDFQSLRQHCERTTWSEDNVYLQCGGMCAGLTSMVSQVKVCLKMAVEAGTGIILPSMPLRDSSDLTNFNFLNTDAYMPYDKWFDMEHLVTQFRRVCPQMRVIHPDLLDSESFLVKNRWNIDFASAPGYQQFQGYFWSGRPFRDFFNDQYANLKGIASLMPDPGDSKKDITIIAVPAQFLIFRITDDPTSQDLRLWNDLSHLVRFLEAPRKVVHELHSILNRPFYGVHFRVESDTIWSALDHQLRVDLDALDRAWTKYGRPGAQKPLVYLACGDQEQVEKFVAAGKLRGWEVTHKWLLAQSNADLLQMINDLPFDFQGAVDMGIMVKSHFFLGITGSAFSSTIGNVRDATGRYRGSSFTVFDDENARTHLFNDGEASGYPCCL